MVHEHVTLVKKVVFLTKSKLIKMIKKRKKQLPSQIFALNYSIQLTKGQKIHQKKVTQIIN